MITLKEWMELVDYRITEGSNFCWDCYGPDVYALDSWNGDQDGHSFCIYFDTKTQEVYEVQAHDYRNQRAYRLINPAFKSTRDQEADRRNVDLDQAWDDVNYYDIDVDDDFIQKSLAIRAGENYDTRISVSVDFTDEELLTYMKLAHDRDITFNQLVEMALLEAIAAHKVDDAVDRLHEDEQSRLKIKKKKKAKK